MSAQLGLDKLAFFLPATEVSISPDFNPKILFSKSGATGEPLDKRVLYTAGGRAVTGKVAVFNTDDFQFDIQPDRAGSGSVCSLHFSGGAFADSNLEPLQMEQCFDVARRVEAVLKEHGVTFPINRALIVRTDIAQNVSLSHPVACYAEALDAVGARKRASKKDFGVTGFYIGNKSWEIGFYDKGAQMKKLEYPLHLRPVNTIRPEVRLKKARLVRDYLGCETLPELRRAWPRLKSTYVNLMMRDVFRSKREAKAGASIEFQAAACHALKNSPTRPWQRMKSDIATQLMVQHLGLNAAKELVLSEFPYDPDTRTGQRQIERINDELERADFRLRMQKTARSGHKVNELYKELREKVLVV